MTGFTVRVKTLDVPGRLVEFADKDIADCANDELAGYFIVCDRWLGDSGFINFFADVGPRPSDSHSLDRIDNDKGYYPDNCRWATSHEQNTNRRNVRLISFLGKTQCIASWCREFNLPRHLVEKRLKSGLSIEEVFRKEN